MAFLKAAAVVLAAYHAVVPPTAPLPGFSATIEEHRAGSYCFGVAFDQKLEVKVQNHPITRISAEDTCLDGIFDITMIYKGSVSCANHACDAQDLVIAQELLRSARAAGIEQNRAALSENLQQMVTAKAHREGKVVRNGRTQIALAESSFIPEGSRAMISYAESPEHRAFLLYTIKHNAQGVRVKVYYDENADLTLDSVLTHTDKTFEDAYRSLMGALAATPSAEEKALYEDYSRRIALSLLHL